MCLDCLIHGHQYELINTVNLFMYNNHEMPYGVMYIQRCKKCGKIKKKKVKA